ncbi:hypothetical protein AU074_31210 [Pseudomonas sp. ATCC PTA-122608]|nr:hypothetical protein AU074_31210 [Pseudomonas sp. ATCC PTA-122608]
MSGFTGGSRSYLLFFGRCICCDSRSLLRYQSVDFGVKPFGENIPVTRPVTTLMAIGAQGYSIGNAIRTLLGEVLDVMYFKKWLAVITYERCRLIATLANTTC